MPSTKALNQSWQDLPCLRVDAVREALEDVSVASWTQYPAPTPDTAYKWSREKKAYALFPKCKFWRELIGKEVYILGVDTEKLFTYPYLYKVVADDVGKTPATFRGDWYFINRSNYTIGHAKPPDSGLPFDDTQPRTIAAVAVSPPSVSPANDALPSDGVMEPVDDSAGLAVPPLPLSSDGGPPGLAATTNTQPRTQSTNVADPSPTDSYDSAKATGPRTRAAEASPRHEAKSDASKSHDDLS